MKTKSKITTSLSPTIDELPLDYTLSLAVEYLVGDCPLERLIQPSKALCGLGPTNRPLILEYVPFDMVKFIY